MFHIQAVDGGWTHLDESGVDDTVEYCTKELNNQKFAGYEDWENPTIIDFYSFLSRQDYENNYFGVKGPNENAQRLFENVLPAASYWTTFSEELLSQSSGGVPQQFWMHGDLKIPIDHQSSVGEPNYVRCVRKIKNMCFKTP